MVRIYIRHSEKAYDNGKSEIYKHDPPITSRGQDAAENMSRFLCDKYGMPICIVCSPYRRTRETAIAMRSVLSSNVPLKCDRLLQYNSLLKAFNS